MPRHIPTLTIDGAVAKPVSLDYHELEALPAVERDVSLDCGKGTRTACTMAGPTVGLLIELARARDSACRAIFHCSDGHRETLSLTDLLGCEAFLALSSDEQGSEGQRRLRLVVPGKFGERWAKYVERIELVAEG